jgi:hypothetical protein
VNRGAEARRECARCVRAPVKPAGEEWREQRNVAGARSLTFTHLAGLNHGPQRGASTVASMQHVGELSARSRVDERSVRAPIPQSGLLCPFLR